MLEPLDEYVEITKPDGTRYRWDGESYAANIPTGITHSSKKQEGHATASCVLNRRIDLEYVDIDLRDEFTIVSAAGDERFHGRISAAPRSLDDGHSIQVEATGYMSSAKDRKFAGGYVDRDVSSWHEPPLSRRIASAWGYAKMQAEAGRGGLTFTPPAEALVANEAAELHYDAGDGGLIGKVMYKGARTGAFTNFSGAALLTDSVEDISSAVTTSLTLDSTVRTATPSTAERYGMLRVITSGSVTPGQGWLERYDQIAVYENHGLTTRAISGEPDGIYASDVMQHIIESYCPKLTWAGNDSSYPIPHLVFKELTYPYDALLTCNSFHLWNLACWEDGNVYWSPLDLSDWDWEIRLEDPGVQAKWEGDSDEDLANGIIVEYTDLATGATKVLYPDEHDELRDDDPLNPANSHGDAAWTDAKLANPATQDMALQIGRAMLAEFNLPKHPGSYTISGGYIRDRQGRLQPGSKVRAMERVAVTSSTTSTTRLIGEASWSQDSATLAIGTDGPIRGMDAFNDRLATALQANNLT